MMVVLVSFCYFVVIWILFMLVLFVGKAWGIAGPPVLSAIGRVGGQNQD
jgi:hypothetical protein